MPSTCEALFVQRQRQRTLSSAERFYVMPSLIEESLLEKREKALIDVTSRYLGAAVGLRVEVPFSDASALAARFLSPAPPPASVSGCCHDSAASHCSVCRWWSGGEFCAESDQRCQLCGGHLFCP